MNDELEAEKILRIAALQYKITIWRNISCLGFCLVAETGEQLESDM
jgi:hypothetical protein